MKKKIFISASVLCAAICLCSCGTDKTNDTQVSGSNVPQAVSTASSDTGQDGSVSYQSETAPARTLAPAATPAPDALEKAQAKIDSEGEENANISITSSDGETHNVSLKFSLINNTGEEFHQLLLVPATQDIKTGANILPENFVFSTGQSIELNPGENATLDTSIFNIAAITEDGKGYIFQNIDLAANSIVELSVENGVPKATMQ